jgi:hypothetical protein
MQVPRDINGIEIEVQANGVRSFCVSKLVNDGTVDLPRTLGIVPGNSDQAIVTVIIRAFNDADTNPNFGCMLPSVAAGMPNGPAIVRRSTQTYVGGHELYLPMPLRFSCLNEGCTAEMTQNSGRDYTCKGGTCVDVTANDLATAKAVSAQLVDFQPSLVDGSDVCFSPSQCFPISVPPILWTAIPVDPDKCIYGFPPGAPQGTGLNVRVFYDVQQWAQTMSDVHSLSESGEVEILDEDPVEGFTQVTATDGGAANAGAPAPAFQLAPGLCKLVKNATTPPPAPPVGKSTYVTITNVQVSALCAPKVTLLPICKGERAFNSSNLPDGGDSKDGTCNVAQPLTPTPSAVYMVMDDSTVMSGALGPNGSTKVLSLSLSDPIFKRTSAAFTFLPHDPTECPGGANTSAKYTPSIPFALANTVQPEIAKAINDWVAPDATQATPAPLDLLAAMRTPNGAYDQVASIFSNAEAPDIAAVMFFVNRLPDPTTGNECAVGTGTVSQAFVDDANAAFAGIGGESLRTFFVVLGNSTDNAGPFDFFSTVASSATPGAVTTIDARSMNAAVVLQNFSNVITQLGTCLYEQPPSVDTTTPLEIQYVDPLGQRTVTIPQDPSCGPGTQANANGWNFDTLHRLRICGDGATGACGALRSTITFASAAALASGLAAPDIPVTATVLCKGTAPIADSGATPGSGDASVDATTDGGAIATDAAGD